MFLLSTTVLVFIYVQLRGLIRGVRDPGEETQQNLIDQRPDVSASLNPTMTRGEKAAMRAEHRAWAQLQQQVSRASTRVSRVQAERTGHVKSAAL